MKWLERIKGKNKNIHYLSNAEIPAEKVLETAAEAGLESLTVIGWKNDGNFFMATSYAKRKDVLWDVKVAEGIILDG